MGTHLAGREQGERTSAKGRPRGGSRVASSKIWHMRTPRPSRFSRSRARRSLAFSTRILHNWKPWRRSSKSSATNPSLHVRPPPEASHVVTSALAGRRLEERRGGGECRSRGL